MLPVTYVFIVQSDTSVQHDATVQDEEEEVPEKSVLIQNQEGNSVVIRTQEDEDCYRPLSEVFYPEIDNCQQFNFEVCS